MGTLGWGARAVALAAVGLLGMSFGAQASQSSRLSFWEHLMLSCPSCVGVKENDRTGLIRATNRHIVEECVASVEEGMAYNVRIETSQLCRKRTWYRRIFRGNRRQAIEANYGIAKRGGQLHIDLKLRLVLASMATDSQVTRLMMTRAQACIPIIANVFERYGIRFNLSLDTPEARTPGVPNLHVDYRYEVGRPNNGTLYYFNQEGDPTDPSGAQATFCETFTHEVGHMLGLEDEYEDSDCPDREYISSDALPYSIMDTTYWGLGVSEFFPRHIDPIIQPLCE